LSPPLRLEFEHTDRQYKEGEPLRVSGAVPPAAADVLFMNYGLGVKAFDLKRKAEAWHFKMASGVEFAAFVEDGLLLADSGALTRVDSRSGKEEWRHLQPRMRGFAVLGPFVYFLAPDPKNEAAMRVWALDAAKGGVVWSQGFEGTPASDLFPAGGAVVFTTVEPYRIQLFEAETGKRLLSDATFTRSPNAQVLHASEDTLILHSEGRILEAYDLPAGTLRWRANVSRMSTRAVEVGPQGVVLLGTQRTGVGAEERAFLSLIHLRTGKFVRMQTGLDAGDPKYMLLDGARAYLVSREADRSIGVRAVRLEDLSVEWKAVVGEDASTLLPPSLARDHVVLAFYESGADGKYAYGGALLDKEGKVRQNIRSEYRFERPPGYGVANGRLIYSVDSKVDVHR
ncbi:MAG TPA: PQQ-binding-like beta-propeller repeat protein, partial [Planctomycetota bacterium]|nr:PQQ-binding-like beta-propeller repeat protein [Planctomycetota bacterium]